MPLTLADLKTKYIISRIAGNPTVKAHLSDLGFTAGGEVYVISSLSGNLIVSVKGARVAVGSALASKIFVHK